MNRYVMAGEALRLLVSGEESLLGCNAASLRSVFRTGAEACEQLDDMIRQLAQALQRNAELEALLSRAAEVLSREPLPIEGGSWAVFELARELRCSLVVAPAAPPSPSPDAAPAEAPTTLRAMLEELGATRRALEAADTLAVAQRVGDTQDVAHALVAYEQASLAYHLVAGHRPADEGAGS